MGRIRHDQRQPLDPHQPVIDIGRTLPIVWKTPGPPRRAERQCHGDGARQAATVDGDLTASRERGRRAGAGQFGRVRVAEAEEQQLAMRMARPRITRPRITGHEKRLMRFGGETGEMCYGRESLRDRPASDRQHERHGRPEITDTDEAELQLQVRRRAAGSVVTIDEHETSQSPR
jgi:hypothetical protein